MPNFFQRRSSSVSAPSASGIGASPKPSSPAVNVGAPSLLARATANKPTGSQPPEGSSEGSVVRKSPAAFWTEYYGAAILVIIALFIAIGTLLLRPLVLEFRRLEGAVSLASAQLADERGYLDSLQGSIGAAQSIPAQTLADVEEALPVSANIPKMLTMMAVFAKQYGADMSGVQFVSGGGDAGSGELQIMDVGISVTVDGYTGLRRFLAGIERNMRVFDLQGISVASTGGGAAGAQTYSFQLKTYYLPQRAKVSAPAAVAPRTPSPEPSQSEEPSL